VRVWNVCGKKTRIQAFQPAAAVWWAVNSATSCTSVSAFWKYVNCVWNTWILIILQIHIWLHWRSHVSKYVYNHLSKYWSVNNWTEFVLTPWLQSRIYRELPRHPCEHTANLSRELSSFSIEIEGWWAYSARRRAFYTHSLIYTMERDLVILPPSGDWFSLTVLAYEWERTGLKEIYLLETLKLLCFKNYTTEMLTIRLQTGVQWTEKSASLRTSLCVYKTHDTYNCTVFCLTSKIL